MSSSDRRTLLFALAALPLAACGFAPGLRPNGPAEGLLDAVRIDDPDGKDAFDLVERLEERLGRPSARYALGYRIETGGSASRCRGRGRDQPLQPDGRGRFRCAISRDGRAGDGGAGAKTSPPGPPPPAAGHRIGRGRCRRRLMRMLADQIVTRLIASLGRYGPTGGMKLSPRDGAGLSARSPIPRKAGAADLRRRPDARGAAPAEAIAA
jgi:LPS-assembly lipoprotein